MPKRNYDEFKAEPDCNLCKGKGTVTPAKPPRKERVCDCIMYQAEEQERLRLLEKYRKRLRVAKEDSFFDQDGKPISTYVPEGTEVVQRAERTLNVSTNYKKQAHWAETVGKDLARCYLVRLTQTSTGKIALYGDVECVIRMKIKMYHGDGLHDSQILWARTNKVYNNVLEFMENSIHSFETTSETLIKNLGFLPLCFETAKTDKEYRDLMDLYANIDTWANGPVKLNLLEDDGKNYELSTLDIEGEEDDDDSGEDSIAETTIYDK